MGVSPVDTTWIDRAVSAHQETVARFARDNAAALAEAAQALVQTLESGGTVFFFGNGGSAADAQHLAAELVNRFRAERRALRGLALTTDTSVLTSVANDADYRRVFARQIEALGRAGDLAVGITTSGRSPSVVEGLQAARRLGLRTLGLLGRSGGEARAFCDHALVVAADDTARIQETHLLIGHLLCEWVDQAVGKKPRA
jgi:D-sedoheptulose 7-phosphate isomerase